jgi:hypothetical protein
VKTISNLRRHFGLQRKPVRVIEPFQTLGKVGWELIDSIGIDVIGARGKTTCLVLTIIRFIKSGKLPGDSSPFGLK